MRVLFVATNLPIPTNIGQAIRSLSIIRALASGGHTLDFVSFARKSRPEDLHPLSFFCRSIDLLELELKNLAHQTEYCLRFKCLLGLKSYSVERFRSKAMQARIQEKLSNDEYTFILCDGPYALTNIPVTEIPIVLNCHNVEYRILQRFAELERNPFKKHYARIESCLVRRAERKGCRRVARAMVCSQADLDILTHLCPDLTVSVVPNVVDTDLIQPVQRNNPGTAKPILLFHGVMDWYPNRDAVEFFIHSILPQIRAECPEATLVVAGRNPPIQFTERFRSDSEIKFTGTVPDMRPYLAAATVVIVPLRIGGGTRIKILEACAAGKPIVSTGVGAEGLDLEPGKEIIVADGPEEFASSVVSLLQNPAKSDALAKSARTAVVERYGQSRLKESLDAFTKGFSHRT
jgi:glycosyltransferase involved in cell wall biosynthesis